MKEVIEKNIPISVAEKFPFIYKILVLKRDRFMAKMIKELKKKHKKILVVVGVGHIKGLKKLLKEEKIKIL